MCTDFESKRLNPHGPWLAALGGTRVGEISGQNEEYGEITGPLSLPSGLARLWVPGSIIRQPRQELGGLPVAEAWAGSMGDDEGIFAWLARLANERLRS